jgi:tetraacyldisaccharide 4'-kinase
LEESCSPSVFLLDDGFQHRRLHRDLDVVLIDCINPFGGGEVFPLGKLREPAAALERADVIVLTRVAPGRPCAEIERRLREWNSRAPIFRAYTRVRAPLPAGKVAAFCGLGNPEAFWRMLAEMGITPVCRRAFPDHHRYLASELMQFSEQAAALGAEVLLTTEKDAMNLPDDAHRLVAPLELSTVSISFEVEDGERLLRMVPVRPKVRSG